MAENPEQAWQQHIAAGRRLNAAWANRHNDSRELRDAIDWLKERTEALERAWTQLETQADS